MANIRPTLAEILDAIFGSADVEAGGVDARIARSVSRVLHAAQAGGIDSAYGFLQRIADDLFADTAEEAALRRHASVYGITPIGSRKAFGWVGASGPVPSEEIPPGTLFRRSDGVEYVRIEPVFSSTGVPVTIGGGLFAVASDHFLVQQDGSKWVVPVEAVEPGEAGNAIAGAKISLVSPIGSLPLELEAVTDLTLGRDIEGVESLRSRLLSRIQAPPQGGTNTDFRRWALDASVTLAPITRAWVREPGLGSGSNVVTVLIVDDGIGFPSRQPPSPSAAALNNALFRVRDLQPVTADGVVIAPTLTALGLEISFPGATAPERAAVENDIDAWLIDNHSPGVDIPLSIMQAVVSRAAAGGDASIVAPTVSWVAAEDELFYRGAVTWT